MSRNVKTNIYSVGGGRKCYKLEDIMGKDWVEQWKKDQIPYMRKLGFELVEGTDCEFRRVYEDIRNV